MRLVFIFLSVLLPAASAEISIAPVGNGFQLLRGGGTYFINGAGGMRPDGSTGINSNGRSRRLFRCVNRGRGEAASANPALRAESQ